MGLEGTILSFPNFIPPSGFGQPAPEPGAVEFVTLAAAKSGRMPEMSENPYQAPTADSKKPSQTRAASWNWILEYLVGAGIGGILGLLLWRAEPSEPVPFDQSQTYVILGALIGISLIFLIRLVKRGL